MSYLDLLNLLNLPTKRKFNKFSKSRYDTKEIGYNGTMRKLALFLILIPVGPVRAESGWGTSLPEALATAKASGKTVFAAFTAPWCYSCYYMERNVFPSQAFKDAAGGMVLVRVDVDQPEGRALQDKHRVRFLPSFLIFDAQGKEAGRIVGEQRPQDFLAQLRAYAAPAAASEEERAVSRLDGFLRRDDLSGAAAYAAKPGPAALKSLQARPDWRRLELRLALKRKPTVEALKAMAELNDDCDFAYDLMSALKGKLALPSLRLLRPRIEMWAERRYWVQPAQRCADFRSGVEAMADYYDALADAPVKAALLERAAAQLSRESERLGVGRDRNLDDNRRFFLEAAGKDKELEELYPRLAQAYPSDYVYAYRFAKWLAGKRRPGDALPWIEKADKLCYGANRLAVTKVHAEILDSLRRRAKAMALLRREVKAYGGRLPKETKPLEELLASLSSRTK